MNEQELSGLFGTSSGNSKGSGTGLEDKLESLKGLDQGFEDGISVDEKIRCNKFLPEFSDNLKTGRGREQLVYHVWWELEYRDGRYIQNEGYDTGDVMDLAVYLLDELDEEGQILGGDLVE